MCDVETYKFGTEVVYVYDFQIRLQIVIVLQLFDIVMSVIRPLYY